MMSIHEGSLYEDQSVESFHKPNRPSGLYQTLKENSKLLYPDRLSTPLSTPEVTSLLSGVERSSSLSLITSQAPSPRFLRGEVTTEQEMYARGFLEALDELHTGVNRQPEAPAPNSKPVSSGSRMNVNMPRSTHHHSSQDLATTSQFISGPNPSLEAVAPTYVTATMDYIPNIAPPSQTTSNAYAAAHSYAYSQPLINHFSPAMDYSGYSSPPISTQSQSSTSESTLSSHNIMMKELQRVVPADSKTQEHMKVERKKARNRIAASKCRLRRLQRESDLQGKVRILRDHNQELNNEMKGLKLQISNLKKALVQHMKGGCQVNLPEGYGLRSDSVSSE